MNENNEYYDERGKHDRYECFHHRHPWLSNLLTALSVLLGAFLAFYVVSDWHLKRVLDPVHQMRKMEKMMMKEDRAMQNLMRKEFMSERAMESYIHLDETPDAYIVVVNLRPFNNDEDNISISADENVITINASNEKNKRNSSKVFAVSQSYALPEKINASKITKKRTGDKYFITVPKSN